MVSYILAAVLLVACCETSSSAKPSNDRSSDENHFKLLHRGDHIKAAHEGRLFQGVGGGSSSSSSSSGSSLASRKLRQRGAPRVAGTSFVNVTLVRRAEGIYPFRFEDTICPSYMNWVERGKVTPVRDQGDCDAAWAFTVVGAVESAEAIATGKPAEELSVQHLLACDYLNNRCDGGSNAVAFNFLIQYPGLLRADKFAPYGSPFECPYDQELGRVDVGLVNFQCSPLEEGDLATAVCNQPVATFIEATDEFAEYSGGIFEPTEPCGQTTDDLNHAILIVGYGTTDDGVDYWLAKNSWRGVFDSVQEWGEGGYIRIKRGINACGIVTGPPLFPVVASFQSNETAFKEAGCVNTMVNVGPDGDWENNTDYAPINFFEKNGLLPGMFLDNLNYKRFGQLTSVLDGNWVGSVYSLDKGMEVEIPICDNLPLGAWLPFTGPSATKCELIGEGDSHNTSALSFSCDLCTFLLGPGDSLASITASLGISDPLHIQLFIRNLAALNPDKKWLMIALMSGKALMALEIFALGTKLTVMPCDGGPAPSLGPAAYLASPISPSTEPSDGAAMTCFDMPSSGSAACPDGSALQSFVPQPWSTAVESHGMKYRCCFYSELEVQLSAQGCTDRTTAPMELYTGGWYSYEHHVECPAGALVSRLALVEDEDTWHYDYQCTSVTPSDNLACRGVYLEVDVTAQSTALFLAAALTPGLSCSSNELLNSFYLTRGAEGSAFYVASCCSLGSSPKDAPPQETAYIADMAFSCIRSLGLDGSSTMEVLAGPCTGATGWADGVGSEATFNQPGDVALHQATGMLYVADTGNNCIRKVDVATGEVTTFAGDCGEPAWSPGWGRYVYGQPVTFNGPQGIAVAQDGSVYVADTGNNCTRQFSPSGEMVAMVGRCGSMTSSLRYPTRVAIDSKGSTLYISQAKAPLQKVSVRYPLYPDSIPSLVGSVDVLLPGENSDGFEWFPKEGDCVIAADINNNCIQSVCTTRPASSVVSGVCADVADGNTLDGTGDTAVLDAPSSLALSYSGAVYFIDSESCLRRTNPAGEVVSLAGSCVESGGVDSYSFFSGLAIHSTPATDALPVTPEPGAC